MKRGTDQRKVVGKSVVKLDGPGLVTGRAAFTDDHHPPGMLCAKILRSPHAHALVTRIDASKALAIPGVHAVLTHHDVPRVPYTTAGQSHPEPSPYDTFILDRKARFVGDRVAAVAAESEELAERALRLIEVDYEPLPAVLDLTQAMAEGAPVIHDEPEASGIHDPPCNQVCRLEVEVGNIEEVFAGAEVVVERRYRVGPVQHAQLEPHVTICYLDDDDRLTVRTSTQVPFHARRILARALQLPMGRIRVIKPRVGGGFGGKQEVVTEDICAALTLKTRRPVRLELNREEEFTATRRRHSQEIVMRTAAMRDGRLLAHHMKVLADTGAYGSHASTVQMNTGAKTLPLYRTEALKFECDVVYTNLPPAGAFRGYGVPQGFFALESQMDEVALAIGMDAIEFRRRNLIRTGDIDPISEVLDEGGKGMRRVIRSCGIERCLDEARKAMGEKTEQTPAETDAGTRGGKVRRGRGAACMMQGSGVAGVDWGAATIKLNDDGSINLLVGATDIGTGSDTVLAQIAAEVLGLGIEQVAVLSSDTDLTPFDVGAYASSTTYVSGQAVKKAAEMVRREIREVAAKYKADPNELKEVALLATYQEKRQIAATASSTCDDSPPPFAAQFAEVEVDTATGIVKVRKFISAVDAGRIINPRLAVGQIEGAVAFGLGYALTEEMLFDDAGRLLNPTFFDYKVPICTDMPEMNTVLVETDEPGGPFGAKAAGEVATNGPAPAIANAIFDAVGVRITSLPMTPEKVLQALDEATKSV